MSIQEIETWDLGIVEPSYVYLSCMFHDGLGLRMYFRTQGNSEPTIKLVFNSYLTYRNIDEGYYLQSAPYPGDRKQSFFKLTKSNYMDWFIYEAGGVYKQKDIQHYLIATDFDVLEIISTSEPLVSLVPIKELIVDEYKNLKKV